MARGKSKLILKHGHLVDSMVSIVDLQKDGHCLPGLCRMILWLVLLCGYFLQYRICQFFFQMIHHETAVWTLRSYLLGFGFLFPFFFCLDWWFTVVATGVAFGTGNRFKISLKGPHRAARLKKLFNYMNISHRQMWNYINTVLNEKSINL